MKKRIKRILAILLAVLLLCNVQLFIAAATEESKMTVQIKSVDAMPGETVDVDIAISNSPGVTSLAFNVTYDSALTLKNVKFNSEFGSMVTANTPYSNPQIVSFISPFSTVNYNGTFATLTFAISEEAKDGDKAKVELTYDPDNIIDGNDKPIDINVKSGTITIFEGKPGDINGDRKVNNADAIMLFRYIAGWNVEADTKALDCNGDGKINNADAIILFRYIAGWDVRITRGTVCEHSLSKTDRKEPSCTEEGNIEYWYCSKCNKYFSDQNATTIVDIADTVLSAKGHTVVYDEAVAPTGNLPGLTAGSHCSVCNKVLTAQKETYSVTFKDHNGAILKTEIVEKNQKATPPSVPDRTGYVFAGWNGSYSNITANTVLIATYNAISTETYTVTFYDFDGTTVLKSQTVNAGANATLPSVPTKENAVFMGWSGNYVNVTKNESVRAVFSDEKNVFLISSVEGNVEDTVKVLVSIDGKVSTCGFDFALIYDPYLELVSYDSDLDLDIIANDASLNNGVLLNFSSAKDKTKKSDIVELTFRIKDTSKSALPITMNVNSVKAVDGNKIVNTDYAVVNGVVSVK